MERSEVCILTNMCMVYNGNCVLVQDKIDADWKGITFPGGHVEMGESFTDAVIREVFEETGLTIASPRLCGIKDWTNDDGSRYMVLLYKTNEFTGEIQSSEEGNVYWMDLDEMYHSNLAEGMDKMLELFLDEKLSEDFFYKENDIWIEVVK